MTRHKKVLIVDDDLFLLNVLRAKLAHEGFSVISASDGEEGLKKAFAGHPDIILLDLVMPRMDGASMLKKLRQDDWGKKASVVVLSNLNNARSRSDLFDMGVQAFLVKVDNTLDDVARIIKNRLGD